MKYTFVIPSEERAEKSHSHNVCSMRSLHSPDITSGSVGMTKMQIFSKLIKRFNFQKGSYLIELLMVIGLLAILLPVLLTGFTATRNGRAQQDQRQKALALLREGQEAVRVVREKDWNNFADFATNNCFDNTHKCHNELDSTGKTWELKTPSQTISLNGSSFTRSIIISDVYRDFSDPSKPLSDTFISGYLLDPSIKKVTTTVNWSTPNPSSVTASEYLTRNDNLSYTETRKDQFDLGAIKTNIDVTNNAGGEIKLKGNGGSGDWCKPNLTLAQQDLPKNGVANGVYAIEGTIFAATGDNASGVSFEKVNVTTTGDPVTSAQSTFDGFKTNSIFGETNYAYLATDNNFKEVEIIDLTNSISGKYQEAGYFDAPGNGNGKSVYVFNNIGFMTDGNTLYTFDLNTRTGSRSKLGNINLDGNGNRVIVLQDPVSGQIYAYVATSNTSKQLQIFLISSDGKTITSVGSKALPALGARDLFVSPDGKRVYMVTEYSSSQNNVFILDTNDKNSINIKSSTTTGGMIPKGITVIQNRAIVVGIDGTYQYQVFKIENDLFSNCDNADPTAGKLTISSGVNGVSSIFQTNGDAFSYIITGDSTSELKIIRGGGGGSGLPYSTYGLFESQTIPVPDIGYDSAFNNFAVTNDTPSNTSINFSIAIKHGPNCASTSFIPSDFKPFIAGTLTVGTNGTYVNPGQCVRYRAEFNSDGNATPTLSDITFNYSP